MAKAANGARDDSTSLATKTVATDEDGVSHIFLCNFGNICDIYGNICDIVDLASFLCDMNWWLSCRVSAIQSVVAGSISSVGDYGIHC